MIPEEYLESVVNDQLVRLYIIKNIPRSTEFKPRTRCEIKACNWFAIADLPNNKKDSTPKVKIGVSSNAFFMVFPFVKRLKIICSGYGSSRRHKHKSTSLSESESVVSKIKSKGSVKSDNDDTKLPKNRDKKNSKRQLFTEDDNTILGFSATSWLNFKFNKLAIMECMT